MEIFGRPPINSFVYYSGKLSGYTPWIAILMQMLGYNFRWIELPSAVFLAAIIIGTIGLLISVISMTSLGASLRFGIPSIETELKTGGLYRFSRNPMYVGFYILTVCAIVYTANPVIALLGIYGIYAHHLITLSEEKFLKGRFGRKYLDYCEKTGRYI